MTHSLAPDVLQTYLAILVVIIALFAIDDLLVDVMAFFKKARPEPLIGDTHWRLHHTPQKRIAIMIANWHESEILERMIVGNLGRIDYQNYYFFLGVYPNDEATRTVAESLSRRYPWVIAVVNDRPGPTSKGQMLNHCVQGVLAHEQNTKELFDLFMLHDSEDVIHPLSLKLINYFSQGADFLQLPVFSFDLPKRDLVGATYIDEFAEHHTKEMILRSKLKSAVPSAGTGTALSRKLIHALMQSQNGDVLNEDTLTEDYHIGNKTHELGFRSLFLCYFSNAKGKARNFIATREYFPRSFRMSIRQKTRWNIGICFQGSENLGWRGSLLHRYFLWRDRRGFWNSILLVNCALAMGAVVAREPIPFAPLVAFNLGNVAYRVLRRMHSVYLTSTLSSALMVPIRWPIANVINVLACYQAWSQTRAAKRAGRQPPWVKTTHELPRDFGLEPLPAAQLVREEVQL